MSGRTFQQSIRPAEPPAILFSGQLTPEIVNGVQRAGAIYGGIGLLLLLLAVLSSWEPWDEPWAVLTFLHWAGIAGGAFCISLGIYQATLPFWRDRARERRLEEWHDQMLAEREQGNNQVIDQEITEWELRTTHPALVLAAVIAVQQRVQHGIGTTPYAVRSLEGAVWLAGPGGNQVRLGDLTGVNPERMATTLAQLGLIRGREQRRAGEWVPQSLDEAVDLFARNWRKVA